MPHDMFKPFGVGTYILALDPDEMGLHDMKAALKEGGAIPFWDLCQQ